MSEQELQLLLFGWYDEHVKLTGWKARMLLKAYLLHLAGTLTPELIAQIQEEYARITAQKGENKNTLRDG